MKKPVLLIAILVLLLILVASVTVASAARSATQNTPGLEGVRWVLVSYKDGQGKTAAAVPDAPATAEFAVGRVGGTAGCNNYSAAYKVVGAKLTIQQPVSTMMACVGPVVDQETAYLANLQAAATYKIDGEQLTIADGSGAVVLTFKAEKPASLVGPIWLMTAFNNGRGGFESAMTGFEVTAVFDDMGKLTGNAGCNTYNATYSADGANIKIGPVATTRMMCEQAIMAQETAYLAALEKATTWKIEGTKLTLRDATGAAMAGYVMGPAAASGTTQTGPAASALASLSKGEGIYLTLRPAADGSVQTVVLSLQADGTAQFVSDFGKDKALTETGAWEEKDGTVTVTLTTRDGAKLPAPVVMKFTRDGTYLNLADFDKATWGQSGLRLNLAGDIVRKVRSPMITFDLAAGFPLDPTFFSAHGGGEVDARLLGKGCSGYINRQPTATVKWTGEADQVRAFFYSDGNPTLVVMTPKGELVCNDNAGPQLLDPFVEITKPVAGDYRIWVGSADKNQQIPGVLVLTTKPGVDLGTFQLGKLVKRPSIPQTVVQPAATTSIAPQAKALADRLLQSAPTLKPGAAKVSVEVTAEGEIPLFKVPVAANNGCAGLVTGAPSYSFKWTGNTDNLHIAFEGDGDSTLMVVGTGNKLVLCNDDAQEGATDPAIDIASPAEDTYLVYVGRVSPTKPVTGKLTVVEAPKE